MPWNKYHYCKSHIVFTSLVPFHVRLAAVAHFCVCGGGGEIGDSAGIVYRVHRLVLWDFEEVWCSSGA